MRLVSVGPRVAFFWFVVASLVGCFRSPDMTKLSCTTSARCPDGHQCMVAAGRQVGTCVRLDDAAAPDAVAAIDAVAAHDIPAPIEHSPAVDIAAPVVDGPSAADVFADAASTASPQDAAPDSAASPEVGPDQHPDLPALPDAPVDGRIACPSDLPQDCNGTCVARNAACNGICPTGQRTCVGGNTCIGAAAPSCCSASECTSAAANAVPACSNNVCGFTCASGFSLCGSGCVDLKSDGANCGTCGIACTGGKICSNGTCQCPLGTSDCGSSGCVNVGESDRNHCGSCTTVCASNETCSAGTCACASSAAKHCGGCLAWDFEGTSDPAPWVRELDPNWPGQNGATNLQVSRALFHGGSASLAAPILVDYSTSFSAEVAVATSCAINLAGYKMSAWVYVSGPELTDWGNGLQIDTWSASGQGDYQVLYWGNIPIGSWFQITVSFTDATPVNRIGIRLSPDSNWQGTMYIDDVVITGF